MTEQERAPLPPGLPVGGTGEVLHDVFDRGEAAAAQTTELVLAVGGER